MMNQSLSEYMNDYESMMETRYLWHDGQVETDVCVSRNSRKAVS